MTADLYAEHKAGASEAIAKALASDHPLLWLNQREREVAEAWEAMQPAAEAAAAIAGITIPPISEGERAFVTWLLAEIRRARAELHE